MEASNELRPTAQTFRGLGVVVDPRTKTRWEDVPYELIATDNLDGHSWAMSVALDLDTAVYYASNGKKLRLILNEGLTIKFIVERFRFGPPNEATVVPAGRLKVYAGRSDRVSCQFG